MMKFYKFYQNNPGGWTERDLMLDQHVFVQAHDLHEACYRLERAGGYFDGCSKNMDCSCCGDRWSRYAHEFDKPVPPSEYFSWNKPANMDEFYAKVIYADMTCLDLHHDGSLREAKDHSG